MGVSIPNEPTAFWSDSSALVSKARVAMIASSFVRDDGEMMEGGAERHLLHLAQLASARGANVAIFQPSDACWVKEFDGFRVVGMPTTGRNSWRSSSLLAINSGATHLYFHYLDKIPIRQFNIPISAATHGVFWDHPYDSTAVEWYPHGRLDRLALPAWRSVQRRIVMTNLARCTSVLSTDSSFYHVVQSQVPRLRNRVHMAFNFTDLTDDDDNNDVYSPDSRAEEIVKIREARALGRVVILVPRNLSLVRGGAWLPRIIEEVTSQLRGDCQFVLTGMAVTVQGRASRYERAFKSALEAMSNEARSRLTWLNGLPHHMMRTAYRLSDVTLIPTYSHESTSLAAIEAMGSGCVVVATNVGGLSDVIVNGWTGVLVQPRVEAINEALVRLARDVSLRERLAARGKAEAQGRFTLARWQEQLLPFMEHSGWIPRSE